MNQDLTARLPAAGGGGEVTLEEVARLAGVSRSTASRVINGAENTSSSARDAVSQAVQKLGYAPNRAARMLVTRRTDTIALVIPEPNERVLSDPFFAGVLGGLSSELDETDLQLVLLIVRRDKGSERAVRYVRSGNADGVIVVSHHRDDELNGLYHTGHLPVAFIGRPWSALPGTPYVDTDNVGGARMATQHLIDRGARRIAFISGPADMTSGMDRLLGFRKTMSAAGMPSDIVATGDYTAAGGLAAMRSLLSAHPEIDAVFAASDLMATGALEALSEAGLRVPDDVAVIGYDDLGVAESTKPRLTTVDNPVVAMARSACTMLLAQLAGTYDGRPIIIPARLIPGQSA